MKYICEHTNKEITLSDITAEYKVQRALRSHLTRCGVNSRDILCRLGMMPNVCGFCGREVPYRLSYMIQNDIISVSGFIPGKNTNISAPFYCGHSLCEGKSLNRNSVEFVSVAYDLSTDDAIKYIHERNKSPFYPSSHQSVEHHRQYQRNQSLKVTDDGYASGASKRSLEHLMASLGTEAGKQQYDTVCSKKKHTKQSYIDRYGQERGMLLWLKQKNVRSAIQLNTSEDLYNLVLSALEDTNVDELITTRPDHIIKLKYGYPITKRFVDFDTTLEQVLTQVLTDRPDLSRFDPSSITKTVFGYWSHTDKGTLLRSKAERSVYTMLHSAGLTEDVDFFIDKPYNINSKHRYDFYFPAIDTYIEMAGMLNDPVYYNALNQKIKSYNVVVVTPNNYITKIKDLINAVKSTLV